MKRFLAPGVKEILPKKDRIAIGCMVPLPSTEGPDGDTGGVRFSLDTG